MITAQQLKAEELRIQYSRLLEDPGVFPTKTNWDYIIDNRMEGLGHMLLRKYIAALTVDDVDRADLHQVAISEFPRYLQTIPRQYALEVVYGDTAHPEISRDLIRRCMLFDAIYISNLIDCDEIQLALDVIDVYQPEYSDDDLAPMQRLLSRIDNLSPRGYIERRQGLLGSSMRYICPNGHANDGSAEFCTHSGCGLNARGMTEAQAKAVEIFRRRVDALENLLE